MADVIKPYINPKFFFEGNDKSNAELRLLDEYAVGGPQISLAQGGGIFMSSA